MDQTPQKTRIQPERKFLVNLRTARELRQLTQRELGHFSKVSQSQIAWLEKQIRTPQPRTVRRLAKALQVSPGYLYGDEPIDAKTVTLTPLDESDDAL